jgi:hypothetical protein
VLPAKEKIMDFDAAIKAHSDWKMKLRTYLRNPDKTLRGAEICLDNKCDLGRWIHTDGAKYASYPEFRELKVTHAQFHRAAGAIVDKANSGVEITSETALGSSSEFAAVSQKVVSNIMALRRKVA